jgi:hypothetical protein
MQESEVCFVLFYMTYKELEHPWSFVPGWWVLEPTVLRYQETTL